MKVQEYRLLSQNATQDLTKLVNEYLEQGWKLHCGPSAVYSELGRSISYFQAVVREIEQPGAWG